MIRPYRQLLEAVPSGRWALPTFNTFDLLITRAILKAGEHEQAPLVLEVSERALKHGGGPFFMRAVQGLAEQASIPVALHYDHGENFSAIRHALALPFSSIMRAYDLKLSLSQNIALTKKIVALARTRRVSVQGEVGHVTGPKDHWRLPKHWLTDPQQAADFAKKTAVNSLAVSIGNRHGVAAGSVQLDWGLLAKIKKSLTLPLVLHGGSGLRLANYARVIREGIAVINFDTDLRYAFGSTLRLNLRTQGELIDPRTPLERAAAAVEKVVRKKIVACRAQRRANRVH